MLLYMANKSDFAYKRRGYLTNQQPHVLINEMNKESSNHRIEDLRREFLKPKYAPLYGMEPLMETLPGVAQQVHFSEEARFDEVYSLKEGYESTVLVPEESFLGRLRSNAEIVRKILGLDNTVRLEDLRDVLLNLGAKTSSEEGIFPIVYPLHLDKVANVSVWEVDRLYFTPNAYRVSPIMYLYSITNQYAETLKCHPVVALAFLLCNIPVRNEALLIIVERFRIEIVVNHPEASAEAVRKMYSLVRNSMIRSVREVRGKWARPRSSTRRVVTLGKFIVDNQGVGWEELLRKWNSEHPGWEYKNVNSMAAAYSRLKAKMRKGTGFVKYWFADSAGTQLKDPV